MSFEIQGTSYGIATQEEAYACGLLNNYTTAVNGDKRLLSMDYVQSNSQNVSGPNYDITSTGGNYVKVPDGNNYKLQCKIPCDRNVWHSSKKNITINSTITLSNAIIGSVAIIVTAAAMDNTSDYNMLYQNNATISSSSSNTITISCSLENIGEFRHKTDTFIYIYIASLSSLNMLNNVTINSNSTTMKCKMFDKLITGKSFQSYNITRPWHWRISEDYFWGSVGANTITAQYRYSDSTSTPNSMSVKDFLSRGSDYFGGSISGGVTIQVNMPVNRFYILGRTGSLASLPKYDKLSFWCGSTKSNSEWYGYYAQRNSAGELLPDWKNQVTLASSGTSIVHGNDSQDAPFYSWNFLQSINNAYGVHVLVI